LFFLLSDTKKTMFYVVQLRPKLDYTYWNEISVLFSKIEPHDVPYLSRCLFRDTLRSCIVDRIMIEGYVLYFDRRLHLTKLLGHFHPVVSWVQIVLYPEFHKSM
jgi:hypothetical protein